jgi:hypothetical protein
MSPILLEHLPRLVEISRIFAARLEEDPSAWGVSVAFLAVEEQLEAALVDWSGVVGQVISAMRVGGESQAASDDGHTSSAGSGSNTSWIRRRSATAGGASQPFQLNLTMTPVIGSKDKKTARIAKSKRLTEQDLAIMPTQRVLRYVLMYRGKSVGWCILVQLADTSLQSCCYTRHSSRRRGLLWNVRCKVLLVSRGGATRHRRMSTFFPRHEKRQPGLLFRLSYANDTIR